MFSKYLLTLYLEKLTHYPEPKTEAMICLYSYIKELRNIQTGVILKLEKNEKIHDYCKFSKAVFSHKENKSLDFVLNNTYIHNYYLR